MLSPVEKSGLRSILNDLSECDLFPLADTVTKKLMRSDNKQDAIQSILSCIEKPSDLLRRQRITKKVLFRYLLKIKPAVQPDLPKAELILMCLEEWKSEKESEEQSKVSDFSDTSSNDTPSTSGWLDEFGIQFCDWYFPKLNELQEFGPEHFWVDCRLIGELRIGESKQEASVIGDSAVATFLMSLVINDKYYFDANATQNSIVTEQEPHGMVKIVISGVVHQFSNCIGLFDWIFGLVRNPAYNNNWKIKSIQMKIHVTSSQKSVDAPINCYPSICQKV